MNAPARLTSYASALVLVFGVAWGAGATLGPAPAPVPAAPVDHADDGDHAGGGADGGAIDDGVIDDGGGLSATAAGYTLLPGATAFTPGVPGEFAFTVSDPDGRPVRGYDVEHDRPMHLIVVRRDGVGFQHLHPELDATGTWRGPLVLPAAGVYRAYADFVPTGGPALTLGVDLVAPGDFAPAGFVPSRVAQVDGYQVRLDGELVAGRSAQVFATISRDGAAVTDLEPHLGAFGHLVALRRSDLSYLHVHPDAPEPAAGDRAGPGVAFTVEVPSAGDYQLFLDFRHAGAVHTAAFALTTPGSPG